MSKIQKLIYLDPEDDYKLNAIMKYKNYKNKSDAIRNVIRETEEILALKDDLKNLSKEVIDNKKILLSMYEFIKKFYSDMEIE